jgi:hypothetical protein
MSKEKQIEEMAHDLCHWWNGTGCTFGMVGKKAFCKPTPCKFDCTAFIDAERLYNNGYRKQSEWISVDERLPEKHGLYLIVWDGSVTAAYRHTHWTLGEFWNNDLDGGISVIPDSEVTHWMPLPEPPKMKGGAE